MSILTELKILKRERAEKAPFSSLLEFEEWSDSVLPLLSFHQPYEQEFSHAAIAAGVAHRMDNPIDSNTNMNMAVGILNKGIKKAELMENSNSIPQVGFEDLLHPAIIESSLTLYSNGHLREAVLNSIIAVFDLIRGKRGQTPFFLYFATVTSSN